MTASFFNGFKISGIDQLFLALIILDLGLFWSKKLVVKFSRVFISYLRQSLNINFFGFFVF